MSYIIIGHLIQYILAGVGVWQLVTGSMLVGIIILFLTIAVENIFPKSIKS